MRVLAALSGGVDSSVAVGSPGHTVTGDARLLPTGVGEGDVGEPGVLAAISNEFARHGVSIRTVRQDGSGDGANLVITTHRAPDGRLHETVEALRRLSAVREVVGV